METTLFPTSEACLIWLDVLPESLAEQSWQLAFRDGSFLGHCIASLRETSPWPLLMVGNGSAPSRVKAFVESCNVPVYWTKSSSQLFGLTSAASHHKLERALFVHLLFGLDFLFPRTLLSDLSARHRQTGCGATALSGLPEPMKACVCEKDVIDLLASLPLAPEFSKNLIPALELLDQTLRRESQGGSGILTYLSSSTDHPRSVPLLYIPWTTRRDLRRLEDVLDDEHLGTPPERLAKLRQALVDEEENAHHKRAHPNSPQTSAKARVLFASAPSGYSGAEASLIDTIASLRDRRVDVHALVAKEGFFTDRLRRAGAAVHCPDCEFAVANVRNMLLLDELLDSVRPNVIHCNGIAGAPLLGVAKIREIPLVQWVRLSDARALDEHLVCADRLTCVSQFVASQVSKRMIRTEKIRVVYDGVDVGQLAPGNIPARNIRKELGISNGDFLILCVARFVSYKRHDVLLEAVARVSMEHPHVRLVLIGEPSRSDPTYQQCQTAIARFGLGPRTALLGFQRDVHPFELAADAIVLCSQGEPLGTVVLESMALARPIIVAESGGLPEMITNEETGLHCTVGSVESLCKQISRLVENPDLGSRLGRNARAEVERRFSLEAHASSLMSVYRELPGWLD